jgi:hypothetical protein
MTVRELISKKDYDYISFRVTVPPSFIDAEDEDHSESYGVCHSINGELIPDDGDSYSIDEELVHWEEWSNDEFGIQNGLTVVEQGVWE